ncbi:MAG TPA: histidine kinase [Chitinophagaceae bacterium]|nr:histidine kinase [Chitinophagaceae bacterium]
MKVSISTYWKYQLIGWGAWFLFDYLIIRLPFMNSLMASIVGLAFSHFLRFLIKQFKILNKNTVTKIIYLLLLNSIVAFLGTSFILWVLEVTGLLYKNLPPNSFRLSFWGEVFWSYEQTLTVGTAWIAIYFAVHYIRDLKKTEQEKNDLRIRLVEMETQSLRAQMNPQFIFNSMNSIKSLITKNENDKASNYLTTFSKLIRTLFQNSDKREISLFEEIETGKLYTKLEQLRFDNKIDFVFNIDEAIDLKDIKVPALLLQTFIENAIWHGLVPIENGGKVIVSINEKNGGVDCVIDDNGIGRALSKQHEAQYQASHQLNGISLTHTRLDLEKLLNERENSITIIDKKNESGESGGTKVIISFKENRN